MIKRRRRRRRAGAGVVKGTDRDANHDNGLKGRTGLKSSRDCRTGSDHNRFLYQRAQVSRKALGNFDNRKVYCNQSISSCTGRQPRLILPLVGAARVQAPTLLHRIGRTGRWGTFGVAVTYCVGEEELRQLQGFIQEVPEPCLFRQGVLRLHRG